MMTEISFWVYCLFKDKRSKKSTRNYDNKQNNCEFLKVYKRGREKKQVTFFSNAWSWCFLTAHQHGFTGANSRLACVTRLRRKDSSSLRVCLWSAKSNAVDMYPLWEHTVKAVIWSHTCRKLHNCPPPLWLHLLSRLSCLRELKKKKNEGATLQWA